jgi:hypothetical protein
MITGPTGATGPTGVQSPTGAPGATGALTRKVRSLEALEAYHTEMPVRRYDVVHVKEDLQRCYPPRRWISALASGTVGMAVTALFAGLAGLNATPETPLVWRVIYFGLAGAGAAAALVLFKIDADDHTHVTQSIGNVESRLDELISMFPASGNED